jgi:hypothetical protein
LEIYDALWKVFRCFISRPVTQVASGLLMIECHELIAYINTSNEEVRMLKIKLGSPQPSVVYRPTWQSCLTFAPAYP